MSATVQDKAIAAQLEQAEDKAQRLGLRFTAQRRYVLEIILSAAKPLGAYEILEALTAHVKDPKPPIVYRALEFLQEHHFIHRIESLNAYTVCDVSHDHKGSQFLICDSCGAVEEVHLCHLPDALQSKVDRGGFAVSFWNAELHGLCALCQAQ